MIAKTTNGRIQFLLRLAAVRAIPPFVVVLGAAQILSACQPKCPPCVQAAPRPSYEDRRAGTQGAGEATDSGQAIAGRTCISGIIQTEGRENFKVKGAAIFLLRAGRRSFTRLRSNDEGRFTWCPKRDVADGERVIVVVDKPPFAPTVTARNVDPGGSYFFSLPMGGRGLTRE